LTMTGWICPMLLVTAATAAATLFLVRGARPLTRKTLRLAGLALPLAVFPLWGLGAYRALNFTAAGALALLEAARLRGGGGSSLLGRLASPIAKEGEEGGFSGLSTYFWGAALASLAPVGIGPAVTVMANLGDPWASMAGSAWGGRRSRLGKTRAGMAACLAASLSAGLSFAAAFPGAGVTFFQAALAAAAMTAAEKYSPGEYDNLLVQAAGAVTMVLSARPPG